MKDSLRKIIIFLIISSLVLVGCANDPNTNGTIAGGNEQSDSIKVYASFYPYYDFANNIGGENIDINIIVPAATEPHSFEPSPKVIADLESADVFIYNGLDMEPWLDKVLTLLEGKDIYLLDASRTVDLIKYGDEGHHDHDDHTHDHDENHSHDHDYDNEENNDHDHGEYDPHIWVDPNNAIKICENIKEAFVQVDPDNKDVYEKRFNNYKVELEKLDSEFREGLSDATERKIIVSHSAFGYLAKRYNIEEIAVAGISPHAEPSPKRLAELTKVAKNNKIDYIFFEALASVRTAEILANEANLEILTLYNIEGLTEEQKQNGEDYISLMYKNLETLKKALVK